MVRRYDEPIEVTSALARRPRTADPEAFIWRGRLFVVRAVLDRWQERRAWWRDVGRDEVSDPEEGSGSPHPRPERLAAGGVGADRRSRERRVWRVEASAGKAAGTGVFDLGADGVDAGGAPQWVLLRSHD